LNALTAPGTPDTQTSTTAVRGSTAIETEPKDYFVSRDGVRYAGSHLIIDLWDAHRLGDLAHVDRVLRRAALDTGATILHGHFHHFGEGCGVSGVLVLAESHVSIHTWPERGYAALDIFVCGGCDAYAALPALRAGFSPGRVQLAEHKRGLSDGP
jgi:S-adenosylmethionine decarboxylase